MVKKLEKARELRSARYDAKPIEEKAMPWLILLALGVVVYWWWNKPPGK